MERKGIKRGGREPSWRRRDKATSMVSYWMDNPTDNDELLLKHQLSPLFLEE